MQIVNFNNLKPGDELLIIRDYGKQQAVHTIKRIGSYDLVLENGEKVSTYGNKKMAIAIKADHPDIMEARRLYELKAIASTLYFGRTKVLENPDIAKKLLEIKVLMGDDFAHLLKSLQAMSAIGCESSDIRDVAQKLFDNENA